jgi:hypothetical protein
MYLKLYILSFRENRKENGMFGLYVLEASLALLYSNQLSAKLINDIFTVRFLDKLDSEVAACYSKVCLIVYVLVVSI